MRRYGQAPSADDPPAVRAVTRAIASRHGDGAVAVDVPEDGNGTWWIEIVLGARHHLVSWDGGTDYGLFDADDETGAAAVCESVGALLGRLGLP